MNKEDLSCGEKNERSVLLKFYIRKVFSKIKISSIKKDLDPVEKIGRVGNKRQYSGKQP
jgi:hypothetical protein